jgi:8-oxo-dGTP pyrophosphatase MutT (NUDIX family)
MKFYDDGEYRASKDWPYAIAAGCVVYRQTGSTCEVLLLSRDYDHDAYSAGDTNRPSYHLPKGHVKISESLEAAAIRETAEEIGAQVELSTYLGSLHHVFNHPRERNTNDKTIHYFAAQWRADSTKTDNEHDGREWVKLENAAALLGLPNPKGEDEIVNRLKKFLDLEHAA